MEEHTQFLPLHTHLMAAPVCLCVCVCQLSVVVVVVGVPLAGTFGAITTAPNPSLSQRRPGLPLCFCKVCSQLNLWRGGRGGGGGIGEQGEGGLGAGAGCTEAATLCLHCCLGHKN